MTIEQLKENGLIIFEGIVGSQAYGIATPTSDIDIKGVFMSPFENILDFGYVEQVSDETNDTVYYEIRRFLQLLQTNNPTILELLNLPEDCILHKDPIFDMILDKKNQFITKQCKYSFGGYAIEQIKKARGLNKKIVKPMEKERKGVLDFCFVSYRQGSINVEEYLRLMHGGLRQEHISLTAIPHMRYTYGAYITGGMSLTGKRVKGIVQDREASNEVSLSEIPKGIEPAFVMQFNKDGYSTYCKEYREYWDWVEKRNPQRFADNMLHEGGYDGKNLAHCHRLLDTAIEIGEGKGINVRRHNRDQLLSIRRGEYDYDLLVKEAEDKIAKMDSLFEDSILPESIDIQFVNELLLKIRKIRYSL
jgi:predicted nucleotidyltransferase